MNIRHYRDAKMRIGRYHLVSYHWKKGSQSGFGSVRLKFGSATTSKEIKEYIEKNNPRLGEIVIMNIVKTK